MPRVDARRALSAFVAVIGTVAVIAGAGSVLLGLPSLPGRESFGPIADSEFRFYAVWYVVIGLLLLRSSRHVETAGHVIGIVAWAFFAAGCARILSWFVVGRPHWTQIVLMVIELLLPAILIPWQRSVARRAAR